MRNDECNKKLFLLLVWALAFCLVLVDQLTGQTFTTLHSFNPTEGYKPRVGLVLAYNLLYGANESEVFAINSDGTGFQTIHTFINNDGFGPHCGALIFAGDQLYGAAGSGGSSGGGTVFTVKLDGTAFKTLHSFNGGDDGGDPLAGLVLSGNTLYGATQYGGSSSNGVVFALNIDGTGFTNLHSFSGSEGGAHPIAGLVLSSNVLYGTTYAGGSSGNGTVFALHSDGTSFELLHSFTATTASYTNSDGAEPNSLMLAGNKLYGTAEFGGIWGNGTVFAVNTDGTAFTNLHSFSAMGYNESNGDGSGPFAGLLACGSALYGTAQGGGNASGGTIFALNADGSGFRILHRFTDGGAFTNSDGVVPLAALTMLGNNVYGTASGGGVFGAGTVFSVLVPPELTIARSSSNIVMAWPSNFSGFTLQSTPNPLSPAWTVVPTAPVVVNGQNTVTNPISGTQQFSGWRSKPNGTLTPSQGPVRFCHYLYGHGAFAPWPDGSTVGVCGRWSLFQQMPRLTAGLTGAAGSPLIFLDQAFDNTESRSHISRSPTN